MSNSYEEIIEGETWLRHPPGPRHERVLDRLHAGVRLAMSGNSAARLLDPRSVVRLAAGTILRPDLALVTVATGRVWLAAEVISSEDHRPDTVVKKQAYEEVNVPRLWLIDTRYDNVEFYEATEYGLKLKGILAGKEVLAEKMLPGFEITMTDLFAP